MYLYMLVSIKMCQIYNMYNTPAIYENFAKWINKIFAKLTKTDHVNVKMWFLIFLYVESMCVCKTGYGN